MTKLKQVQPNKLECDYCGEITNKYVDYVKHWREKHSSYEPVLKCPRCQHDIKGHKKKGILKKRYICRDDRLPLYTAHPRAWCTCEIEIGSEQAKEMGLE